MQGWWYWWWRWRWKSTSVFLCSIERPFDPQVDCDDYCDEYGERTVMTLIRMMVMAVMMTIVTIWLTSVLVGGIERPVDLDDDDKNNGYNQHYQLDDIQATCSPVSVESDTIKACICTTDFCRWKNTIQKKQKYNTNIQNIYKHTIKERRFLQVPTLPTHSSTFHFSSWPQSALPFDNFDQAANFQRDRWGREPENCSCHRWLCCYCTAA